jgi:hypothetical protein
MMPDSPYYLITSFVSGATILGLLMFATLAQ